MRRALSFLLLVAAFGAAIAAWGYRNARADPIVRAAYIALPDWPQGAAPVRVALLSDIHIESAAMDAVRLARIVGQVDALRPDLVLVAGDSVEGHDPGRGRRFAAQLVAPLSALHPPLGVVAILGNHDYMTDALAVKRAFERAGVTVVVNGAVRRGPLAIGGLDDQPTRHADLPATLAALYATPGAKLVLAHSPDISATIPARVALTLAGHTHCGQIVLPLYGPLVDVSNFGARYRCGMIRERGRATVVTAGLGTSVVPFRFGAPPDLWLLTLGPGHRS